MSTNSKTIIHDSGNDDDFVQYETWLDQLCEMNDHVDHDEEQSISSFDVVLDNVVRGMNDCDGIVEDETMSEDADPYHHGVPSFGPSSCFFPASISADSTPSPIRRNPDAEQGVAGSSKTRKGGKSLDRLLKYASSSSPLWLSSSAPSLPEPSLLTNKDLSSIIRRRSGGGKAMRHISSQKRFQAQHRRRCRSLEFRRFLDLPSEVLSSVMSFMDVPTLSTMRLVNKKSNTIASRDDAGWTAHCHRQWKDKVHVSPKAKELQKQKGRSMEAYMESVRDACERQYVQHSELCYDPVSHSGTVWSFRFKSAAGPAWTSIDPWYSGGEARRMVFLKDGTVRQLVTIGSTRKLIAPFSDIQQQQATVGPGAEIAPNNTSGITMLWRYIDQPLDNPSGPQGSYIRINVSGRDVPTYICRRPKEIGNWGFVVDSLWGVFASFPIPRRRQVYRLRRTSAGLARWLNVDGMESDDSDLEDDETDNNRPSSHLGRLLSDNALPTTGRRQWKEALIYNYGTRQFLPQGEEGMKEFDRLFKG